MKLEKVTIDHFRCFQHLEIEFPTTTDSDEPDTVASRMKSAGTTIFVAKNGDGKTAILDAIAYLLNVFVSGFPKIPTSTFKNTDFREVWELSPQQTLQPEYRQWNRLKQAPYMRLSAQMEDGTQWDITKNGERSDKTKTEGSKPIGRQEILAKARSICDRLSDTTPEELFPILGYYGTDRAVIYKKPERRRGLKKTFNRSDAYLGALDGKLNYKTMIAWIQLLENEQLKGIQATKQYDYVTFEQRTIQLAVERVFPELKNLRLCLRPLDLEIDVEDGNESFKTCRLASQLSDGYKTTLLMVLDIVSRMLLLNPVNSTMSPERVLQTPGIVLIDEVDLHLHPSWQQRIVVDLQRTFPNVQFIITTHSPQVISSVPKEVVRLINQEGVPPYDMQTQGVESQMILQQLFSTPSVPQNDEYFQDLMRYAQMETEGRADTEEGKSLYKKLENHYSEEYPPLRRIEIHKRFIAARKTKEGITNAQNQ